jgi:hypothetical protein
MSVEWLKERRNMWDIESKMRELKAVRDEKISLLKASKMFNILRTTLTGTGMNLVGTVFVLLIFILRG